MKFKPNSFWYPALLFVVALILQACSGAGQSQQTQNPANGERGGRGQGGRGGGNREAIAVKMTPVQRISIQRVVDFKGALRFDHSKPDGTPRKLLDVSKLTALGWTAKTPLEQGLAQTYRWFLEHEAEARGLAAPAL